MYVPPTLRRFSLDNDCYGCFHFQHRTMTRSTVEQARVCREANARDRPLNITMASNFMREFFLLSFVYFRWTCSPVLCSTMAFSFIDQPPIHDGRSEFGFKLVLGIRGTKRGRRYPERSHPVDDNSPSNPRTLSIVEQCHFLSLTIHPGWPFGPSIQSDHDHDGAPPPPPHKRDSIFISNKAKSSHRRSFSLGS